MTALPSPLLTVTAEEGRGWVRLRLTGDLDYDTSHELVGRAGDWLAVRPDLRDLRLGCAELSLCDSMGVSALLQIHRDAVAQGVTLQVEDAPPFLDRIMQITGIHQLFALQEDRRPARGTGEAAPPTEHRPSPSP
ncbi:MULTISPECIES: STAS domain-containing protein [unclassified Streptomyces]|uniref:STAS domain-containing protein n=1 Tax=unclassified Streptomyces TaxID=2593676 RepID=UPI00136F690C|nr:STAS domain-containing protein [Streptomyces sp. YIM 132580]MXG26541.1 STAS domain-containing protein [Streptomyces sp. YIM 132580]